MLKLIEEKEIYAELINKSGKQRMLSQRTAFLVHLYGDDALDVMSELKDSYNTMESDHNYIVNNLPSEEMRQFYFEGDHSLENLNTEYLSLIEQFINNPNSVDHNEIKIKSFNLLPLLDQATHKYESEVKLETQILRKKELHLYILAIGIILLEAFFIVFPLLRKIIQSNKKLAESEEELQKSNTKLAESNQTKDKLFSIISHDLRGPIGTYLQVEELIEDPDEDLDKETIDELKINQKKSISSASGLLENLLAWARSNQNQISFNPKSYNLNDIINSCMILMKSKTETKDIKVISEIDSKLSVVADQDMLKFIIRNLGSNALKFTPTGGEIKISAIEKDEYVEIQIADNGIGMSDETIKKVISDNEFHTSFGTQNEKGSGLGLKLVTNFIKKHDSELKIESKMGKGSIFSFKLPRA